MNCHFMSEVTEETEWKDDTNLSRLLEDSGGTGKGRRENMEELGGREKI